MLQTLRDGAEDEYQDRQPVTPDTIAPGQPDLAACNAELQQRIAELTQKNEDLQSQIEEMTQRMAGMEIDKSNNDACLTLNDEAIRKKLSRLCERKANGTLSKQKKASVEDALELSFRCFEGVQTWSLSLDSHFGNLAEKCLKVPIVSLSCVIWGSYHGLATGSGA